MILRLSLCGILDAWSVLDKIPRMPSLPLPRLFAVLFVFAASVTAWASRTKMEPMGNSTFAITRTATTGFDRDVAALKQEAEKDAGKYCTDQGKVMKIVTFTSERPHFGGGYASAKIVFRALDANDPALQEPAQPAPGAVQDAAAPAGVLPTYAGDFYSELLKLDDLRKRGLLTDKEFEAQKKKLIKKSQ